MGRDTPVGALQVQTLFSTGAGMELPVQALVHVCGNGGQVREHGSYFLIPHDALGLAHLSVVIAS